MEYLIAGIIAVNLLQMKKAIVEALASYHDIDFTGCIDDKGEEIEVSLFEFLKQFKTTQAKLDYLLDYGQWEVKRTRAKRKK